jgi:hypothetical protein
MCQDICTLYLPPVRLLLLLLLLVLSCRPAAATATATQLPLASATATQLPLGSAAAAAFAQPTLNALLPLLAHLHSVVQRGLSPILLLLLLLSRRPVLLLLLLMLPCPMLEPKGGLVGGVQGGS